VCSLVLLPVLIAAARSRLLHECPSPAYPGSAAKAGKRRDHAASQLLFLLLLLLFSSRRADLAVPSHEEMKARTNKSM
jgi:hypothetical protein